VFSDLLTVKSEWLESVASEATKDDILSVKQDMENILAPILAKLSEPG